MTISQTSKNRDFHRELPKNLEAEQVVLGCAILEPETSSLLAENLTEDDFYQGRHANIFAAIKDLYIRGKPTDIVSLADRLEETDTMKQSGGRMYLNELVDRVVTTESLVYYIEVIKKKSRLRNLINIGEKITESGYEESEEIDKVIDQAENLLMDLEYSPDKQREFEFLGNIIDEHIGILEKIQQSGGDVIGIPTGFSELDKMTTGLRDGDLIIVAGRPSIGKSSVALSIARRAALDNYPVGIFSLEMTKEQILERMLAGEAHVDLHAMRSGYMNLNDWRKLLDVADKIKSAPIFVDDTPGISIPELRNRAKKMIKKHNISFLIVDYLQLMDPGPAGNRSEQEGVSYISRMLKSTARELNVPVVALSQLNRDVEKRGGNDRRPRLSDLRSSGSLEQEADVVIFLYRDDYYESNEEMSVDAELIIAKQRNGPIGKIHVTFHKKYAAFFPQFHGDDYGGESIGQA